eukprot:712668_1
MIKLETSRNTSRSNSKRCGAISLLMMVLLIGIGITTALLIWHYAADESNDARAESITISQEEAEIILQINSTNATNPSTVEYRYLWYTSEIDGKELFVLNAHDVVQYFHLDSTDTGVSGDTNFVSDFEGVQWAFIDETNKNLFDASPYDYVPRFGGYCALGMAHGNIVNADPNAWSVYNGLLYLSVNTKAREGWLQDADTLIESAQANWQNMSFDNPPLLSS